MNEIVLKRPWFAHRKQAGKQSRERQAKPILPFLPQPQNASS